MRNLEVQSTLFSIARRTPSAVDAGGELTDSFRCDLANSHLAQGVGDGGHRLS
jgi:hypothetical protein